MVRHPLRALTPYLPNSLPTSFPLIHPVQSLTSLRCLSDTRFADSFEIEYESSVDPTDRSSSLLRLLIRRQRQHQRRLRNREVALRRQCL